MSAGNSESGWWLESQPSTISLWLQRGDECSAATVSVYSNCADNDLALGWSKTLPLPRTETTRHIPLEIRSASAATWDGILTWEWITAWPVQRDDLSVCMCLFKGCLPWRRAHRWERKRGEEIEEDEQMAQNSPFPCGLDSKPAQSVGTPQGPVVYRA